MLLPSFSPQHWENGRKGTRLQSMGGACVTSPQLESFTPLTCVQVRPQSRHARITPEPWKRRGCTDTLKNLQIWIDASEVCLPFMHPLVMPALSSEMETLYADGITDVKCMLPWTWHSGLI